jgi:hypothetical protein
MRAIRGFLFIVLSIAITPHCFGEARATGYLFLRGPVSDNFSKIVEGTRSAEMSISESAAGATATAHAFVQPDTDHLLGIKTTLSKPSGTTQEVGVNTVAEFSDTIILTHPPGTFGEIGELFTNFSASATFNRPRFDDAQLNFSVGVAGGSLELSLADAGHMEYDRLIHGFDYLSTSIGINSLSLTGTSHLYSGQVFGTYTRFPVRYYLQTSNWLHLPAQMTFDATHTLALNSITLADGTTPESHGYGLRFESGLLSPNVPEPSGIALFAVGICILAGMNAASRCNR